MKRSDWLSNKELEIPPRPTRIWNLTDEIMAAIVKHHKTSDWPAGRYDNLINFLEELPEFINKDNTKGLTTLTDQIKGLVSTDSNFQGYATKIGQWSAMINLTITDISVKTVHTLTITKNTQGLWGLIQAVSVPSFEQNGFGLDNTVPFNPGIAYEPRRNNGTAGSDTYDDRTYTVSNTLTRGSDETI